MEYLMLQKGGNCGSVTDPCLMRSFVFYNCLCSCLEARQSSFVSEGGGPEKRAHRDDFFRKSFLVVESYTAVIDCVNAYLGMLCATEEPLYKFVPTVV